MDISPSLREVQEKFKKYSLFININTSNMKRALLIGLLLFGMNAQADPGTDSILELKKKAAYYQIKANLEAGEITVKEAQRLWKKQRDKLYKEEGK